jgi:prepilin-type N-terminal cleavage/methylation domain-containing protein/prepilin-type processing-associated H-X9-DG protein
MLEATESVETRTEAGWTPEAVLCMTVPVVDCDKKGTNMKHSCHRGFTLIELLVVIALIAILVALLFPAIAIVEERAGKTKCLSNTRQISQAAMTYFGDLGEAFPFLGAESDAWSYWGRAADKLMPYVRHSKEVFDCPANPGLSQNVRTAIPSAPGAYTDYEINGFLCVAGGPTDLTQRRRQSMIYDYSQVAYAYDYPYSTISSPTFNPDRDRAHRGGINCAYLDGHASWLPDEQFGKLISPTDETTFFNKGHHIWKMQ